MGGFGGEIRARTRDEAWVKLEKELRPEIEERFGLFLEAPLTREAAVKSAREDYTTHCWVLDYYFSK
jgi:hypothetical protein